MAPVTKISNHFEHGKIVIQKCWLSTVTNNLPRGLRTCSWKNKFLTVTLFVCSFVGSRNESMCKFFLKNWRKVLNVKAVVKKWLERLNERHRSIDWINVIDGVGASLLWNALTSKKRPTSKWKWRVLSCLRDFEISCRVWTAVVFLFAKCFGLSYWLCPWRTQCLSPVRI